MFHVLTVSWKRGEVQIWSKTTKQSPAFLRAFRDLVGTPVPNLNTRSFPTQRWMYLKTSPTRNGWTANEGSPNFSSPKISRKAQNLQNLPFKKPKKNYQAPSTWSSSDTQGISSTDNSASNASSKATKYLLSFPQQKMGESFPHFVCHSYSFVRVCWKGLFVDQFLVSAFLLVLGVSIRGEEKLHSESQNLPITSCVNPWVAVQEEFQTTDSVAIWLKPNSRWVKVRVTSTLRMTKNGHPFSGLSCDNGKVDLAIHQSSTGSSKAAFLDMGKIHGNKLVFHVAANIQELITFTLKTPGLSTARPHLPEAPNFPLFDTSPPFRRACYHAYGSCEAILPLRSLVLAGKTPLPWQGRLPHGWRSWVLGVRLHRTSSINHIM